MHTYTFAMHVSLFVSARTRLYVSILSIYIKCSGYACKRPVQAHITHIYVHSAHILNAHTHTHTTYILNAHTTCVLNIDTHTY